MSKEIQKYQKDDLGISYDQNICIHAANCVNEHPEIFNIDNKPWVNLDNATRQSLQDAVINCPSGALKILGDSETSQNNKAKITHINVLSQGPLIVKGNFNITDHDGNILETKDKAALCRCGASQNKPFCDGTHNKIDFEN